MPNASRGSKLVLSPLVESGVEGPNSRNKSCGSAAGKEWNMTFGQGSGVVGTLYVGLVGSAAHFVEKTGNGAGSAAPSRSREM
jgi:hypothetical protein